MLFYRITRRWNNFNDFRTTNYCKSVDTCDTLVSFEKGTVAVEKTFKKMYLVRKWISTKHSYVLNLLKTSVVTNSVTIQFNKFKKFAKARCLLIQRYVIAVFRSKLCLRSTETRDNYDSNGSTYSGPASKRDTKSQPIDNLPICQLATPINLSHARFLDQIYH